MSGTRFVRRLSPESWNSGDRRSEPRPSRSELYFLRRSKMTKSVMPDGKVHNSQWLSPTILIRIGSILMIGLMIGHISAYPWTSMKALQETQLTTLMKSVPFEFMGERSTYWNLYFGWGVLVAVLLLALASILWILPDFAMFRPRSAGAISAIVSSASLVSAYLSFRFFYIPPFILFSIICATLAGATTQLLRQRNEMKPISRTL